MTFTLPPWSFSMLEAFEQCPKKAFHRYLLKEKPPETEQQRKGNLFDKAMESRVKDGIVLPPDFVTWEPKAASVAAMKAAGTKIATQLKLGITRDFVPCGFFATDVWGRAVLDVLLLNYPHAVIIDWKTGKNNEGKPYYDGGLQRKIFAAFVFKHYPRVESVAALNAYENEFGKPLTFTRADERLLWQEILPKILKLERAFAQQEWPANESALCGWCPVVTCNHHPERKAK